MHCPYCQTGIQINAAECPACRLTFPRTGKLLGALPRLNQMVADTTRLLGVASATRLMKSVVKLQKKYPQLALQLVMHEFSEEHPFTTHAFWLFNAGAFAGEGKRGKDNHAMMVVVDPRRRVSAIIPGYGLEPWLSQEALDHLLEMAGPSFQADKWEAGFTLVLEGLDHLLETVSEESSGAGNGLNEF